ncbi:MAG: multiheme c-type cytochrome [Planctomycetota bacterium]
MESPASDEEVDVDEIHRTYLENLRRENRYPTAVSCSQCHPDHFEEWSVSPHAYAMLSPVFQSMHAFITERTGGTNGDFCIRCHTPVGMEREEDLYGSVLLKSPAVVEGVTCVTCHRVESDFGTASGRFSLATGPLSDPVMGPTGNANLEEAINDPELGLVTDATERGKLVHGKAIKSPVISRSAQCGTCHDVNSPSGLRLESAFTEFKNAPASAQGTSCQDCHMSVSPGEVVHGGSENGIDPNFAWGPAARIRSSPQDPSEGKPTKPRKRTNHMFIGPDYSIVHPGIFPHSADAADLTYKARFRKTLSDEAAELVDYLKSLDADETAEVSEEKEREDLRKAAREARKHVYSDWLTFRWEEGWGSESFETQLSETERNRRLAGAPFPWADEDDPVGAQLRRKSARVILSQQFNLLNRAHVERTRILRRALQFGTFEVTRDDKRGLDFYLNVHNATDGHAVPTGFDAERVMFLHVTVRDAKGRLIFQSGDRDPNGDLRDLHSSYVHASAPKSGRWLAETDWKDQLGLKRRKEDLQWRPDPHLFSLQSKFVARTLGGGEREQILAINTSIDPAPFVRPPASAQIHTGRGGGIRKQFRTIPPLSHLTAEYRVERRQLSGDRPYRIEMELIAQMVPVNLIKKISPVGFDMNLSAAEIAKRVAYGHEVDTSGTRKGGAVSIWKTSHTLRSPSAGLARDLTPSRKAILNVPVTDYPFPHTPAEELAARRASYSGEVEPEDYLIQHLGPLLPEIWPGGVPEGLSLFPDSTAEDASEKAETSEPAETTP